MPLVLALLSSALWGGADFLGGTLARRLPVLVVVGVSQLVAGVSVAAVALVRGEFTAPLDYLPWAVAAGLVGALGLVAFYGALAAGTMGVVAPIAALGAVVPVVVGLASGERPSGLQLLGITAAVLGVVLASGPELAGASGPRPLFLAVLAAAGFGFALLFIAEGSRTSPLMTAVGMRAASVPVIALVLVVTSRHTSGLPVARHLPLIALVGIGDVAANLAFGVASTSELVSVVAVLGSLYPVVTVLLARLVHAERLRAVQQAGVMATVAGVALVAGG